MTRVPCAAAILLIAACSGKSTKPASGPTSGAAPSTAMAPARDPASREPTPTAAPAVASTPAPASASGAPSGPNPPNPPNPPGASPSGPGAPEPGAPSLAPPGAASAKVTLADVGLEAGSLDRTTDPCVDFYQFACGGWIRNNPIPADRPRWSRRSEIDERNKAAIKKLLEEAARPAASAANKKLGAYYTSCMEDTGADRTGSAFAPLLARTRGVKDARTWLAAVIELHKLGIPVVWSNHVAADLKDSATHVSYLDAAGLGLPDRDYYVRPELKDKLDGYRVHVTRILGLTQGTAKLDAEDVITIESELARLTKTAVEQRDVSAAYNPTDIKALAKQVKSVDWQAYWKGLGTAPSKKIIVGTPRLFAGLDKLRGRLRPAQWASYFTYHLAKAMAFAMSRQLDDQAFELDKLLTGVEKQRDRSERCIDRTVGAFGELVGQSYVASYFPSSSRQSATQLVDALVKAMADDIAAIDWMADATKQSAAAKLAKMVRMVGYPERWKTYDFDVKRDDLAGNTLRATAFEVHRELARVGKPVDRGEWLMNTYEVYGAYNPSANHIAIPAGILQPPFFGPDRGLAVNLGGIGMVIGHEVTHGFDDQGAQFDGDGNLVNWWQKDDLARFTARGKCVADQYAQFEVLPRKYIQGQLALGENIADLAGVKLAFMAYRALRRDAPKTYVADGFSEDQQFFLAVGQAWCMRERPAETERRLTVDPHAPWKFRVYGALRNLPEFADAFRCAAGTPMRPARTCTVW